MRYLLLLVALICGCRSKQATFEDYMAYIVQERCAEVERIMGKPAGHLHVSVQEKPKGLRARAACKRSPDGAILYFDPSLENLPLSAWEVHAIHEIVHACVREEWETLTHDLEEGVCDRIALSLVPQAEEGMLQDIGSNRRHWMREVERLGMDRLHQLASRAKSEGLEEIPTHWLE